MFKQGGSNLQHATSISFLLLVYARYLQAANRVVHCGTFDVTPTILIKISKSQVKIIILHVINFIKNTYIYFQKCFFIELIT